MDCASDDEEEEEEKEEGEEEEDEEEKAEDGEEELTPPFLDVDAARKEFPLFLRTVQLQMRKWASEDASTRSRRRAADVIKWLITSCINTLPNMARLSVAAQVICVATVSNERGFSDMKLHMTRLRSSLGVEMLEHLMRISIEGRPSEHPSRSTTGAASRSVAWIGSGMYRTSWWWPGGRGKLSRTRGRRRG
jgi:hypothetical protein